MTELEKKLLALLDRIEVEENYALAGLRFATARECGYTVEITGVFVSELMN